MSSEAELLKDSQATALMLRAPKLSGNTKLMELRKEIPHIQTQRQKKKKQMCLGLEINDKYKEFKRLW